MGLFDFLKKGKPTADPRHSTINSHYWNDPLAQHPVQTAPSMNYAARPLVPPALDDRTIIVDGDEELTIYVYDGLPLAGIGIGEKFYVTATDKPVTLFSTATGTRWSNHEDGGVALLYEGRPFGFLPSYSDSINDLLRRGFTIHFAAKNTGVYLPGIPDIMACKPEINHFHQWLKLQALSGKAIPIDSDILAFNITPEDFMFNKMYRHPVMLTLQFADPIPGSQAKRHIEVFFNNDFIGEYTGRSLYYKALEPYCGRSSKLVIVERRDSNTVGYYYRVVSVFD